MSTIEFPASPSSTDATLTLRSRPEAAREASRQAAGDVAAAPAAPTVKEVRSNLLSEDRAKSTFKGLVIFIVPMTVYVLAFIGLLRTSGWVPKLCCAGLIGLCIDALFLVGHDACHQALTPNAWLNRIIGRLAFLPSLHPYSQWDHGHNSMHHGWTNVRGWDPVFVPFSKEDFDRLSPLRRAMERIYRTSLGVGLYYLIEMWGKYAMFPDVQRLPKVRRRMTTIDRLMVTSYLILQIVLMVFVGRSDTLHLHSPILANVTLIAIGFLLPFLFWNASMGFVIYQHHTHPEVPWFGDRDQWSFFAGQVQCVVHVELPRPIELFLHNILDHTAHHVDPRIPLYNLPDAQQRLEAAYPEQIKVVPWTLAGYFRTLRTCRLYDYDNHQWLDYDGTPTSEPTAFRG